MRFAVESVKYIYNLETANIVLIYDFSKTIENGLIHIYIVCFLFVCFDAYLYCDI